MPHLQRPDATVHYEVSGNGPPMLLLAGMLSDSASWTPLIPLLEPHFTLIRPDNRSTGRTTPNDAPLEIAQIVDDAVALMASLGHATYDIVGHSLGGLMGMEIAGLFPDRVNRLTILASAPVRIPRGMAMFETLLAIRRSGSMGEELWLRALYPWIFGPKFFENPQNVESALSASLAYPHAQTVDAMARQISALGQYRPRARMQNVTAPALIVQAEEDILIPNAQAREAFQTLSDVRFTSIADAGHSVVWDATDAVAQSILNFAEKP